MLGTYYVSQAHPSQFSSTCDNYHPPSTADEIPASAGSKCHSIYLDPLDAPYVSIKVFYRPRGGSFQILSYNLAN